jgi:hypothetical protein
MPRIYRIVAVVLGMWMLGWIYLSWPYGQDDMLIHLRYADHLLHQHMVSYDGVHPSFGDSSLLYLAILTALRAFTTSPVLPRAVSSIAHIALFVGLVLALGRALKNAPRLLWLLVMLLLGAFVAPSASRWLDDGMETSICLCFVALLAFTIARLSRTTEITRGQWAWLATLGYALVLFRVEFLLLVGFASLTLFLAQRALPAAPPGLRSQAILLVQSSAPLLGGIFAALCIVALMHSLLPDTAVAKALARGEWAVTLIMTLEIFKSSLCFGMISLLLWLLSLIALLARRFSLATLAANSIFPTTLLLAMVRGQAVQGVRYFEWTLLFSILWNILQLAADMPSVLRPRLDLSLRVICYGLCVALVVAMPFESKLLRPVFATRGETLNRFRAQHLELLRDQHGTALDVGTIGYFSQAGICDPFGLVDGRAFARRSYEQRVAACIAMRPDFIFASQDLIGEMYHRLDLGSWNSCGAYAFGNIGLPDVHYLLVPPWNTELACKATGEKPVPLRQVIPEFH